MNLKKHYNLNVGLSLSVNQLRTKDQLDTFVLYSTRKNERKPYFNCKKRFEPDLERSSTTLSSHGSFYFFESNLDFFNKINRDQNTSKNTNMIDGVSNNELKKSMNKIPQKKNNFSNDNSNQFKMPSFTRFRKELEKEKKNHSVKQKTFLTFRDFDK